MGMSRPGGGEDVLMNFDINWGSLPLETRMFLCRFWIGYFQGRLMVLQGFGDKYNENGA
jgi:hypothetical protein